MRKNGLISSCIFIWELPILMGIPESHGIISEMQLMSRKWQNIA